MLITIVIALFGGGTQSDLSELNSRNLLFGTLVGGISTTIAVYISRSIADRKNVESLGLQQQGMWQDMGFGILITSAMIAVIFLWMWIAGWLSFEGFIWSQVPFSTWSLSTINLTLSFILAGITEELMFRGYIFQNIEEGTSRGWAVLISSVLFSLLHLGNPGTDNLAPVAGIFLAGLFFAYAYLRTGNLWLVIGLHIGWNFFENTVFGFIVSGIDTPGLLMHTISGPTLWTGGTFGPEAGLVLLPALAIGTALVYLFTKNR